MGTGRGGAGRNRGGRPGTRRRNAGGGATRPELGVVESEDILNGMRNGGAPGRPVAEAVAVSANDDRARRLAERRERRERMALQGDAEPVTLTPTERVDWGDDRTLMFQTSRGNLVEMNISGDGDRSGSSSVSFYVNGTTRQEGRLSLGERQAISMRLLSEIRRDARTRPDGYRYYVSAATSDGFGAERGRAYEAIGFSRPAYVGGGQVARVVNGRLTPADR